jgi:hypothetical protein
MLGNAGVSGGAENPAHQRGLSYFPYQRMFPSATSDYHHPHDFNSLQSSNRW